jgi:hypothetical protein
VSCLEKFNVRTLLFGVFGAKQENGTLRKRYSYEIYEIFNESNIVNLQAPEFSFTF